MYIYIYICNHENNVPSRLSPQWLCGNSYTWAHDVRLIGHMIEHMMYIYTLLCVIISFCIFNIFRF